MNPIDDNIDFVYMCMKNDNKSVTESINDPNIEKIQKWSGFIESMRNKNLICVMIFLKNGFTYDKFEEEIEVSDYEEFRNVFVETVKEFIEFIGSVEEEMAKW
jgi:hypothetical protein